MRETFTITSPLNICKIVNVKMFKRSVEVCERILRRNSGNKEKIVPTTASGQVNSPSFNFLSF